MPENSKMVAALKRERAALEAQGNAVRVAQVDAQLKHYGYEPDATNPHRQPPQGRSATPPQAATSPAPVADDLDALRKKAEDAGVMVDKRWGADRLKQEIADAKPKNKS